MEHSRNMRDPEGNTSLHILLRNVGRTVGSSLQTEYDTEVVDCVKLLLNMGAGMYIYFVKTKHILILFIMKLKILKRINWFIKMFEILYKT